MSVAQSHPCSSKFVQVAGCTAQAAVVMSVCVVESIIEAGGRGVPPLVDASEFVQHLLHLVIVDGRVVVGETVARLRDTMEHQQVDAVLPRVGTASDAVEELVILQPQGRIPGLPVCPSVEGRVGHAWFVCLCVL